MKRKWRENEEMERDSHSIFSYFPVISSLSIHFLYPIYFSQKVKYGTSRMSKNLTYTYEKIILGRIHCEKAPQVVRAW